MKNWLFKLLFYYVKLLDGYYDFYLLIKQDRIAINIWITITEYLFNNIK